KYKRDRLYRRCDCPKWVEGRFKSERVRKSASTRLWDEVERFQEKLEEAPTKELPLSVLHSGSVEADPIASAFLCTREYPRQRTGLCTCLWSHGGVQKLLCCPRTELSQ